MPSPKRLQVARILVLGACALLFRSLAYAAEFDIRNFVGKSQKEIDSLIGPAESCKQTYLGFSCKYLSKHVEEVVFINARSDWVLMSGFKKLPFDYRSIERIGLTPGPPTVANPFRMHWDSYAGLAVISVYGSGKFVSFIQVRAYTPQ